MTVQQMFVAYLCILLATQQIAAVVNNPKSANLEDTDSKNDSNTNTKIADAVSAASEQETKRREAPILAINDNFELPLSGGGIDSYVPTGPSNHALPLPVYGVPDAPSNNIVYPAPPPDIPPPLPSSNYGPPVQSLQSYGLPHSNNFGSSHLNFIPPPPPNKYLPPIKSHKHFGGHSFHSKPSRPRPQYGPPHKPLFVPKLHKPKPVYGPPKAPLFVPQKPSFQQQAVTIVTIPTAEYGVPNLSVPPVEPSGPSQPVAHYGPPEPIAHGPPHPGIPAPPTPPDIKYDGWQPIPGLVSRPPSDSYGVPEGHHHGTADLQDNADFTPPPIGNAHLSTSSHSLDIDYSPPTKGVSDSYGAPLNAVTGSGAIDSSSGDAHHDDQSLSLGLSAAGISGQNHLSVVKSIGYELFPNSGTLSNIGDSYSAPPLSSYSPDGPYAASHSYKTNGLSSSSLHGGSSLKSHQGFHGHSLSSDIGLVPPSGVYGAPPSSHYGTPLLSKPSHQYGAPLNALKINPPKHPVVFREPVPQGLIESIGQHTAHKDAHGIIQSSHSNSFSSGPTYIPPPIPDVTKPVKEEEPPAPSHLYSLPNPSSSISFQNVGHGSLGSFNLHSGHFGGGQALTSYTAPLGSVDGSYGLPLHTGPGYSIALDNGHSGGLTVGIDNTLPPVSIDLTSSTTNVDSSIAHLSHGYAYQGGHDCQSHGSKPLPPLTYGVPSASSYTASLSSLTTNIGGAYQGSIPPGSYNVQDLETEHSKRVSTVVPLNAIEGSHGKSYGKSLAQSFGPDAELVKSQSLDINNIPLQGSLGSYTLQIQSADGLTGPKPNSDVSHTQVLNGGLLQSILAAIEQPERKETNILGRPLSHLKPSDSDGQHSVTNAVVVPAPVTEATSTTTPASETNTDAPLRLIDNNEIALYFSNNLKEEENKNNTSSVRNGQQYGNYVSFKTPNSSFVYGNLPSDKGQETGKV